MSEPPDPTAVAKMDGFDDLPRVFRDELNYSAHSLETPGACMTLLRTLAHHPHHARLLLERTHHALNRLNIDDFTDAHYQNRRV